MSLRAELVDEINVLSQFSLSSDMQGIKVHSDAKPEVRAATQRLFDKGLITQQDGGYLTALGRDAVEHTREALRILTSKSD